MKFILDKWSSRYFLLFPILILGAFTFVYTKLDLESQPALVTGLTLDLSVLLPLFYYLGIRNSKVPVTTVVPVWVLSLLLSKALLPEEGRAFTDFSFAYLLPLVEIAVVSIVIYKVRSLILKIRQHKNEYFDFFQLSFNAAKDILNSDGLAYLLATEMGMIYYALFKWKKRERNEWMFTYHKDSGRLYLIGVLIFLIIVETVALHFVLILWSPVVAWVIFGLSAYTALQFFGHLKAIIHRPIRVEGEYLFLTYGLMGQANIAINQINLVELSGKDIEQDNVAYLALLKELEGHNVILHFKEAVEVRGFYGRKQMVDTLALQIDEKERFKALLERNR